MIPNVDELQIQKELTLKNLGGLKPEAPWIKRCDFGVQFTDCILESSSNDLESTKKEKIEEYSESEEEEIINFKLRTFSERITMKKSFDEKLILQHFNPDMVTID